MSTEWVRPSWGGLVLGGCVLLQPVSAAAASDWFADDFETGALIAPEGRWDNARSVSPNTLVNGAQGAHRGQYGLTLIDRNNSNVSEYQGGTDFESTPLTSEFFLRSWMRLRDVGNPGKVVAIQANPMKVELRLLAPDPIWELSVRKGTEQTYASVHGTRVEQDRWYLVEFSARGLGTTHGEARLWVDGVEQGEADERAALSGIDWRNTTVYVLKWLQVGEPWTDQGFFTGSIDFDDLRVSAVPMASRLQLQRPADASTSSGCIAVDVSLRSSATGALAPAPYETEVSLATTAGEGHYHADGTCKSPVERVRLPTGTFERRVYFRPGGSPGRVTLAASHPDFLPATLQVEADGTPVGDVDGGAAGGPWTMGLGCTSAPGALVPLPVLLWPWFRRSRRGRTGAATRQE
ncbi:LamG domain-containing protein [Cystobacter fuscus]|uniref:LamG-like jellyroll fold domain-containing protein n=1 Tax=Cystobacter fuscus TaxID=43 RepID=UPI002B2DA808|nr:LamG domain-containing protein [Cystobacter fuscus]